MVCARSDKGNLVAVLISAFDRNAGTGIMQV